MAIRRRGPNSGITSAYGSFRGDAGKRSEAPSESVLLSRLIGFPQSPNDPSSLKVTLLDGLPADWCTGEEHPAEAEQDECHEVHLDE